MKKTKIISIFSILFFGIILLSSFGTNININKVGRSLSPKSDLRVFWFPARVKIDKNDLKYKVVSTSNIRHGSKDAFDKDIWKYLTKRFIVVGPFQTITQATMARSLYEETEDRIKFLADTGMPPTIYWFNVHFVPSPRLKIYVINRLPASVTVGKLEDFRKAFYFQMQQQSFPIGPFYLKENAEEAKRIYRQNE